MMGVQKVFPFDTELLVTIATVPILFIIINSQKYNYI